MNKKRIENKEWVKHIQEQKAGELSQADYCRRHGIKLSTFHYWKRKLLNNPHNTATEKHSIFFPVPVSMKELRAQKSDQVKIMIRLGKNQRIELDIKELLADHIDLRLVQ